MLKKYCAQCGSKLAFIPHLEKVTTSKPFYSTWGGRTTSLDELIKSLEEGDNKVSDAIKELEGKGLRATWACENWSDFQRYIEEEDMEEEDMEEQYALSLKGWFYDPKQDDGDGGNIYIRPSNSLNS